MVYIEISELKSRVIKGFNNQDFYWIFFLCPKKNYLGINNTIIWL